MTNEERITKFWSVQPLMRLCSADIALWFALLEKFRESGFPPCCEVQNEWLCTLLGLNLKTLIAARKRLIDRKYIQFYPGTGRKQPSYSLNMELEGLCADVPMEKPVEVRKPKPRGKPKDEKKVIQPSLFKPEKPRGKPKDEKKVPTIAEVRRIFKAKGLSEQDADQFFYYYDAQDWVTTGGAKIKRLDSMVNRWLTNSKSKTNGANRKPNQGADERNAAVAAYVLDGLAD